MQAKHETWCRSWSGQASKCPRSSETCPLVGEDTMIVETGGEAVVVVVVVARAAEKGAAKVVAAVKVAKAAKTSGKVLVVERALARTGTAVEVREGEKLARRSSTSRFPRLRAANRDISHDVAANLSDIPSR
mmetsp:Transcript_33555/g.72656  ORF Transcript_33555/g.72656 Transcript_33555/m.72656 type:complete len:132 (+) Transcript_33555:1623-2018(+)